MTDFFYSPRYTLDWGEHVFPVDKYARIAERLGAAGFALIRPPLATDDELLLVHSRGYLDRLRTITKTPELGYYEFEVPVTERVIDAFRMATGGTIAAARSALGHGAAGNVSGGFHHAFSDHGEGFCLVNDLAVAIRVLQHEGRIRRAAVVDLDVHQGNGTACIFAGDPSVFTFSIHQQNNYPPKERSTWDIGLEDDVGDDEYLETVRRSVPKVLDDASPDLVLYQAGADPYREDKLGGLGLSIAGLAERDRIVFRECRARGVPVAVTLGGGYARRTDDVVTIHVNTLRLLDECVTAPRGG